MGTDGLFNGLRKMRKMVAESTSGPSTVCDLRPVVLIIRENHLMQRPPRSVGRGVKVFAIADDLSVRQIAFLTSIVLEFIGA